MIITKGFRIKALLNWAGPHIIWLLLLMASVAAMYYYGHIKFFIPWLPVSVVGTAVAFYVGFKNNQAYDRMWEARKIWGGIVNESRSWAMQVDGFVSNQFLGKKLESKQLHQIKERLIYRHIAWLYVHRNQLLQSTPWEHINQDGFVGKAAKRYKDHYGIGRLDVEESQIHLEDLIPENEYEVLMAKANTATQIINTQSRDLAKLREDGLIDDFRHMEMENVLRTFYTLQGKNERIKKFPLPRQYANMSRVFIGIFIAMLPFSMIPELMKIGDWGLWLSIPITAIIGWVYVMMEIVGDYSENPFQGLPNDIPMLSLCRTIEIDLREILNETDLPKPIESKGGILM